MQGHTGHLFRPDVLELSGGVQEVVGIRLGSKLARVGLLDKVLVALLLGEVNGILLALEVDVGALHEITRRLPSHQRVFPSVALGEDVPVHAPALATPLAGLSSGLGLLVDAAILVSLGRGLSMTTRICCSRVRRTGLFGPGAPWGRPRW